MAEVLKTTESGETTQLFIRFVMMQQQQALLALGKHPSPPPGAPLPNLSAGKEFIDRLVMIRDKTRGNLNPHEQQALDGILASLQAAYLEVSKR